MAEEKKVYAEEKDEEVKVLERSVVELESTIRALEKKVSYGISFILMLIFHCYFSIIILVISPKGGHHQ